MRIKGLPVWGVLAATAVLFIWGGLVYGLLLQDAWMAAEGVTAAEIEAGNQLWMLGGVLISLMTVIGLALVLKWRGWPDMGGAIGTALTLAIFFAVAFNAYDLVYLPSHSWAAFFIDSFHLIVGWVLASIVLTLMK